MILTGTEIDAERRAGRIVIEPYRRESVNPNSYNYRLGEGVEEVSAGLDRSGSPRQLDGGYLLERHRLYLGTTLETLGSDTYAMSLIGRSSVGRLGLFVQVSANLGHVGSCHQWTLELVPTQTIIVFPGMEIGQISFWIVSGEVAEPGSRYYSRLNVPARSLLQEHLV